MPEIKFPNRTMRGTRIDSVVSAKSKVTCRANISVLTRGYEPCGRNMRVLKDGSYKCPLHGIMMA